MASILKQVALLPFTLLYGLYYTVNTGIPRKLAGKTFLRTKDPDYEVDYYGHGITDTTIGPIQ